MLIFIFSELVLYCYSHSIGGNYSIHAIEMGMKCIIEISIKVDINLTF